MSKATSNSGRLDAATTRAARQADLPDADIYQQPATHRISSGNLALSIVVLAFAALLAIFFLMWIF
jgi:hypothetical protein